MTYKVEQTALVSGNFTLILSAVDELQDVDTPSKSAWYYLKREIFIIHLYILYICALAF